MEVNQNDKNLNYPQDWEIINLGDVIDYVKGFAFKTKDYKNDGIRIIRVSDTTYDSIKENDGIYLDPKEIGLYKNWELKEYDLILSTVGSKPPMYDSMVGKVILINEKFSGCLLNQNAVIIRAKTDFKEKQIFLFNFFKTKKYIRYIEKIFRGNANQANITLSDLFKFELTIPTNQTELSKIAQVLSDTDELISSLEKLIEKKKLIKQGTMQQLLTGKKRLPGFSGKWEVKKLGNIGIIYGGLSGKTKADFEEGEYPYIPFLNIMNNAIIDIDYFDNVKITSDEKQNKAIKGDLFFNGSSETPEEVGMCSVLMDDIPNLYLNSFCFGFRLFTEQKTNGLYLSYFFRSSVGRKLFYSLAQGATRHNLSKASFLKIEIPYPIPEEQGAIAVVINNMELEIESLEQKLNKYKAIKQGMMQNLLTGKIRLV